MREERGIGEPRPVLKPKREKKEKESRGQACLGMPPGPCGAHHPPSIPTTTQVELGMRYPKLVHPRTEWVQDEGRRRGGWKLTTLPKRILM